MRQYRLTFQDVVGPTATGAVEELTGRRVIGYHSQVVFEPMPGVRDLRARTRSLTLCPQTDGIRPATADFPARGYGFP